MELFHFQGRCEGSAASLRFGAADAFGAANHFDVSGCEEFEDALIETEVADGILNFAFFDVPDAVASEASEESGARVNAANVPKTADEEAAIH